jgi:hypothetical protein
MNLGSLSRHGASGEIASIVIPAFLDLDQGRPTRLARLLFRQRKRGAGRQIS